MVAVLASACTTAVHTSQPDNCREVISAILACWAESCVLSGSLTLRLQTSMQSCCTTLQADVMRAQQGDGKQGKAGHMGRGQGAGQDGIAQGMASWGLAGQGRAFQARVGWGRARGGEQARGQGRSRQAWAEQGRAG